MTINLLEINSRLGVLYFVFRHSCAIIILSYLATYHYGCIIILALNLNFIKPSRVLYIN